MPVAVVVAAPQDVEQRAADELGVLVGLREPARPHAGAQAGHAAVRDGRDGYVSDRSVLDVGVAAPGRQQAQEVGLAGPVRAEHGDPLAEPHLEVERASSAR